MEADSGIGMKALKVDGGASANNYLMQTMADVSDVPVQRPACVETTALGAAYLAGLAVGYWNSAEDVRQNWSVEPDLCAADLPGGTEKAGPRLEQGGPLRLQLGQRRRG